MEGSILFCFYTFPIKELIRITLFLITNNKKGQYFYESLFLHDSVVFRLEILTFIGFCKPSNFSFFDFFNKITLICRCFWFLNLRIHHIPPWVPWPVCCPCTDSLLQGFLTHCSTQKPSTEAGHEQVQHRFGIRDPWFLLTSGRALSADQMLWGHPSSTVAVPHLRPHWLEEANIPMLRAACCGQKENVLKTTVLQKKIACLSWQKCRFHSHLWMTLQGYACDVLCGLTWSIAVCSACSPGSSNTLSQHLQLLRLRLPYKICSSHRSFPEQKTLYGSPSLKSVDVWLYIMLHLHSGTCSV